jgi:hypothetical protein
VKVRASRNPFHDPYDQLSDDEFEREILSGLPVTEHTSGVYDTVRYAILREEQVIAYYNGGIREMCPHAIGTKRGEARALFYQFAGHSESGLEADGSKRNWRCVKLDELSSVSTRPGAWHTATGEAHSEPSDCIDALDLEWWADVAQPRLKMGR